MAIIYHAEKRIFTLNTQNTTYQMQADRYGHLLHLYYGAKISGEVDDLLCYVDRTFSGNPSVVGSDRTYSLDVLPQEYPCLGTGDFRNYALEIENVDGSHSCAPTYVSHKILQGKYALKGLPAVYAEIDQAQTLEITLQDASTNIEIRLLYGVLENSDIITRSVIIRNCGTGTIFIKKAQSACLDFLYGEYDILSFPGRHNMERMKQRNCSSHGTFQFGSRRGTSSHQYNPGVILAEKDVTEDAGRCYGMLFVYSGSFLCQVEKDQFNQTRMLMGLSDELFSYPLSTGEELITPEVILSFSNSGLTKLSHQYHDCILNHICRGSHVNCDRPILLNSWEAFYADFDGEKIVELAKQAVGLGMDTLVLDDGWFGNRNDDNTSLGDWIANEKKLKGSLADIVHHVNSLGLKFGLWFEPEMVSEDSELYRTHPDWVIHIPGRQPIRSRNQLVLDFSKKQVRDEIFARLCNVLDSSNIEYVKWDMNRSLADIYAGNVAYDYMLGVYEILDKITTRYPKLLIEGCSGGGGRFDAGMLYYTPQIWCSDNTDAINRTCIQYGTSFFYPTATMSAHVSAVPNHQTGRVVSLRTRGVVAMTGALGYELDPSTLTQDEKNDILYQISQYRSYQCLLRNGLYYRLTDPMTEPLAAWITVSRNKEKALLGIVYLQSEANPPVFYLRLKGLEPEQLYRVDQTGKTYSGTQLMEAGLRLPIPTSEYEAYQFSLSAITFEC